MRSTLVVVAAGAVAFVAVTAVTGFGGPGPLRRYPLADLHRVAERINGTHQDRGCAGPGNPVVAEVDPIASRVYLRPALPLVNPPALTEQEWAMVEVPGHTFLACAIS